MGAEATIFDEKNVFDHDDGRGLMEQNGEILYCTSIFKNYVFFLPIYVIIYIRLLHILPN